MNVILNTKFIISTLLLVLFAYFGNMSIVMIGGMYLMLAAVWMYFGRILYASIIYVVADVCWAINAYQQQDYFGFAAVLFGLSMGLAVMYKMKQGIFVMDLHAK